MLRFLVPLLCSFLGICSHADAASQNIDITVTPSAATPAVPPAAAAAGFTTTALNSDFSLPKYANAMDNSWLCKRADDNGSRTCEWYDGIWWNGNVTLDGDGNSTIGQVLDTTINKKVLEMTWKKSYCPGYFDVPSHCSAPFNVIETVSYFDQGEDRTPQLATAFPANNMYVEWRYRDNNFSLTDGNDTSALVVWPRCGFNSDSCSRLMQWNFTEYDVDENWANHCGDGGSQGNCNQALQAAHAWGAGDVNGGSAGATWVYPTIGDPDFNTYHTYGLLITSNGISSPPGSAPEVKECSFIDDVIKGCLTVHNYGAIVRASLEMAGGMATAGALVPSTNDQHIWIQSVRVFSCDKWNGTEPARQCNRTGICDNSGPNGALACH